VVLAAYGAVPQAVVGFDWTTCRQATRGVVFQVRFGNASSSLRISDIEMHPMGAKPAGCYDAGVHSLFTVDDVRANLG
jgi:hypothetical protein